MEILNHAVRRVGAAWPFWSALLLLFIFWLIGYDTYDLYLLRFGSLDLPDPHTLMFLAYWLVFAGAAIALIAGGLVWRWGHSAQIARWQHEVSNSPASLWLIIASLLAFAIPWTLHQLVLDGAPLTDDESCYRFMAQLLAEGRVYGDSHALKTFFDRAFMINDGRHYAQYTLGWPALLSPWTLIGMPQLANPFYAALTVPALYGVVTRLVGAVWAKLALVLYVTSPMLAIAAASQMAHTSCLMTLTWLTWFALKRFDASGPVRPSGRLDAGVAICFSAAFFIRPQSALGIGVPLLALWAVGVGRTRGHQRLVSLIAFALPSALFALLFLGVNQLQNGSPWLLSYQRVISYARESGFRFAPAAWAEAMRDPSKLHNFDFTSPLAGLMNLGTALYRLNFALFGWPCSLLLVIFAGHAKRLWPIYAGLAAHFAVHYFVTHAGVDLFGPSHYFEVALPLIILTAAGAARLSERLAGWRDESGTIRLGRLPLAAILSAILVGGLTYLPIRLTSLAEAATLINLPRDTARKLNLDQAVVFVEKHYNIWCPDRTGHHTYWMPNPKPGYTDAVLWANHLSVKEDAALIDHFPGRHAYFMYWQEDCTVHIVPLGTR